METNKLAQIAYRAYGNWIAWKTPQGHTMPPWSQLPFNLQNAWTAAIGAIVEDIVREETKSIEPSPCVETQVLLPVYAFRYTHNGHLIDATGKGSTGENAFQAYIDELIDQGEGSDQYQFISAVELPVHAQ